MINLPRRWEILEMCTNKQRLALELVGSSIGVDVRPMGNKYTIYSEGNVNGIRYNSGRWTIWAENLEMTAMDRHQLTALEKDIDIVTYEKVYDELVRVAKNQENG